MNRSDYTVYYSEFIFSFWSFCLFPVLYRIFLLLLSVPSAVRPEFFFHGAVTENLGLAHQNPSEFQETIWCSIWCLSSFYVHFTNHGAANILNSTTILFQSVLYARMLADSFFCFQIGHFLSLKKANDLILRTAFFERICWQWAQLRFKKNQQHISLQLSWT